MESATPSRRSSYCGAAPYNAGRYKKPVSATKQKERQDWLKKYSPLSSSDLSKALEQLDVPTSCPPSPRSSGRDGKQNNSEAKVVTAPLNAMDPSSEQAYMWLSVVSVAVVYSLWSVITRMTFGTTGDGAMHWMLWLFLVFIDIACSVVYAVDVYVQLNTGFLNNGILETKADRITRRYKAAWKYYIDIASAIPFDLLLDLGFHNQPLLLCFRLLKFYRLQEFQNIIENRTHYPNACRAAFLVHNILLIIHWNGCIYYFISRMIGFGTDQWVYPINETLAIQRYSSAFLGSAHSYVYCFYWSTVTLTTIGGKPEPVTTAEHMFMTVDYLVGILMFATLVGNIGGIITNIRKAKAKFQGKLDRVKSYMKAMDVPDNLQARVIKWFDYLWTHGHPVDNNTALNALPDKLKAEIAIHVHFETLKKVDFFDHCDQSFLWELVLRLQIQVYSPGDYVCRKGDMGREMYIVSHGKLEVVAEEEGEVLRVLHHGDYFGEISVLNLGGSQKRRTAFVRSVGYSDLLCLSQNDLLDVLYDYPQAMELLQNKGREKLGTKWESDDELSDIASSGLYEADTPDDVSDEMGDLPATQADVRQVTEQLLDLQIKMYDIENMVRDLVKEIRAGAVRDRGRSSLEMKDDINIGGNAQAAGQLQIVLTPPADGISRRISFT